MISVFSRQGDDMRSQNLCNHVTIRWPIHRTRLKILEHGIVDHDYYLVPFQQRLQDIGCYPLLPTGIEIFQVNLGKMCNQVCKHCHVDAGPDRKEIMTRDTMQLCLDILQRSSIKTVDLTGGAPELNPDFRWFVDEIKKAR